MKRFESIMAPHLYAYIHFRRGLGYTEQSLRAQLRVFDQYLQEINQQEFIMEPSFFLQLRADLKQSPITVNRILSALRGFFQFLIRQGLYVHNPVQDIPLLPERVYVPFVFSPAEVEQLLEAASMHIHKTEHDFLTDLAVYQALVLMARSGLRVREPVHLLAKHYRPGEGTIYIEKTKFRKDRLIPVPRCALTEIENYLAVRKELLPGDNNPYLLAGRDQARLRRNHVFRLFKKSVKTIELEREQIVTADLTFGKPRPHSLRHAFAINTLKRIRVEGKDPQHALPVLAAYMGHRKYHYTASYLKVMDPKHHQGLIDFAKSRLEPV